MEPGEPISDEGGEERAHPDKVQRSMGSEEWTDPWARQSRTKTKKMKNEVQCSPSP